MSRFTNSPGGGSCRVAIVGFGYIGCTIGAVLSSRGATVTGIDTNQKIRDKVNAGQSPFAEDELADLIKEGVASGRLSVTGELAAVANSDIVLISVGTPLASSGDADLAAIKSVAESISSHLRDGHLVIIKSTLPPGATQRVVKPILRRHKNGVLLAFCPERLAEGQAVRDLLSIPIVVGGVDEPSTKAAEDFLRSVMPVDVIRVSDSTAAELTKLADNVWIDLNIALANEIALISDQLGIDAVEVIEAANSMPKLGGNVNILQPSFGVGGYCLTKDPWFFQGLGAKFGIELEIAKASRRVNERMPAYGAKRILQHLSENGIEFEQAKVAILGVAFKSNTGDCRLTPTKPLIDSLVAANCRISCYDPWVADDEFQDVFDVPRVSSMDEALDKAHVVAFLAGHREFHALSLEHLSGKVQAGALIFDGRMYFSASTKEKLKKLGLIVKGVGR